MPLPAPPVATVGRDPNTRPADAGAASGFDRAYSIVVTAKGLYGLVELLAGFLLLFVPDLAGRLLAAVALELAEGGVTLRIAVSHAVAAASAGVAAGATPLALFLLVHGIVKLLTAYALLRRAIRWYPWALGALGALLVVQAVDLVDAATVGAWILAVLDVAVVALVAWEYRRLRAGRERKSIAPDPAGTKTDACVLGSAVVLPSRQRRGER